MSDHYTPPDDLVDGTTIDADDINDVSRATLTGFNSLESETDSLIAALPQWRLLETQTLSNDDTIDFTGLDTKYDILKFTFHDIAWTGDTSFAMIVQTGGSSWHSDANDYVSAYRYLFWFLGIAPGDGYGGATDRLSLSDLQTHVANEPLQGELYVRGLSVAGGVKTFNWDVVCPILAAPTDIYYRRGCGALIDNQNQITGVRFYTYSSGTLVSGRIKKYGWSPGF